jgi:hypothetical protein
MSTAYRELILQDAAAATGNGLAIGFAEQMRFGTSSTGAKANQGRFPNKFSIQAQIKDTATGTASATLVVEDSADNVTYATLASITLTMAVADGLEKGLNNPRMFTTQKRYIRARLSALAGGTAPTVNAYAILGGGGV